MINAATKADQTYTIDQFIDMQSSDETTYYNYSINQYLKGFEFGLTNILYDYADELEEQAVIVKLDKNLTRYRYRPSLLAFDLYKSVEADFIIKMLNGFLADSEFDFLKVKVLLPATLSEVLGRIYSANSTFINTNRTDVADEKKKDTSTNSVW